MVGPQPLYKLCLGFYSQRPSSNITKFRQSYVNPLYRHRSTSRSNNNTNSNRNRNRNRNRSRSRKNNNHNNNNNKIKEKTIRQICPNTANPPITNQSPVRCGSKRGGANRPTKPTCKTALFDNHNHHLSNKYRWAQQAAVSRDNYNITLPCQG